MCQYFYRLHIIFSLIFRFIKIIIIIITGCPSKYIGRQRSGPSAIRSELTRVILQEWRRSCSPTAVLRADAKTRASSRGSIGLLLLDSVYKLCVMNSIRFTRDQSDLNSRVIVVAVISLLMVENVAVLGDGAVVGRIHTLSLGEHHTVTLSSISIIIVNIKTPKLHTRIQ